LAASSIFNAGAGQQRIGELVVDFENEMAEKSVEKLFCA
jgi:hypothetical protein